MKPPGDGRVMSDDAASNPGEQTAQPTAPENIRVTIATFETEERATAFGHLVAAFVRELSRHIDLSALDGVTIAADYDQALLTLDLGYETSHRLTRTSDVAIGVAMTPSVMREGMRKSHMVFNAGVLAPLEDSDHDAFGLPFIRWLMNALMLKSAPHLTAVSPIRF